jgi:hypothetical protein
MDRNLSFIIIAFADTLIVSKHFRPACREPLRHCPRSRPFGECSGVWGMHKKNGGTSQNSCAQDDIGTRQFWIAIQQPVRFLTLRRALFDVSLVHLPVQNVSDGVNRWCGEHCYASNGHGRFWWPNSWCVDSIRFDSCRRSENVLVSRCSSSTGEVQRTGVP